LFFQDKRRLNVFSIVPRNDVNSSILAIIIAILTCLASLTLSGISLIQISAKNWKNQVLREATIQILPTEKLDMGKALGEVVTIVKSFGGIADVRIISRAETEQLLAPWFDTGFDDVLPLPRLVVIKIQDGLFPDFDGLRDALQQNIPEARLDDHKVWIDRLTAIVYGMLIIRIAVFFLILSVIILTIIFATRGILSSYIVEVLHFISADADVDFFIGQCDCYFFCLGFKGALAGGICAVAISFLTSVCCTSWITFFKNFMLIIFIAILIIYTSHYATRHRLREIKRVLS